MLRSGESKGSRTTEHGDDDTWASRWRTKVVQAFTIGSVDELNALAIAALKRARTHEELASSGAGFLVADKFIWEHCSSHALEAIALAEKKWKLSAKDTKEGKKRAAPHPCGPLRARGYTEAVKHFETWLKEFDHPYETPATCKEAAKQIAVRGFENWRQLEGLDIGDVAAWSRWPAAQALLTRVVSMTLHEICCDRVTASSSDAA